MTDEEIRLLAKKYHTPGEPIKKDWHPEYQKECEMINRKYREEELLKKHSKIKFTLN